MPMQVMLPEEFPPIWQNPEFEVLFACLRELRLEQPVWNLREAGSDSLGSHEMTPRLHQETAAYLSGIIKSRLLWISNEEQREQLWEEASKRLSERSGRAAMGEMTRRWPFDGDNHPRFELLIREPSISGDGLGFKTWGSSYLLAHMLPEFSISSLSHLFSKSRNNLVLPVLELGSGTGVLGLAAAAIWQTEVVLSDLPMIMPNLLFNVEQNRITVEALGGRVYAGSLTWGAKVGIDDNHEMFRKKNRFKMILGADSLYDDDHPQLLAEAIHGHLSLDLDSRAIIMAPLRDETTVVLVSDFKEAMKHQPAPLACTGEGTASGRDDWGVGAHDEDPQQVQCWWGMFRRFAQEP